MLDLPLVLLLQLVAVFYDPLFDDSLPFSTDRELYSAWLQSLRVRLVCIVFDFQMFGYHQLAIDFDRVRTR